MWIASGEYNDLHNAYQAWKALAQKNDRLLERATDLAQEAVEIFKGRQQEIDDLKEALAFYADEKNWDDEGRAGEWQSFENLDTIGPEYEFECDNGERARKAIG